LVFRGGAGGRDQIGCVELAIAPQIEPSVTPRARLGEKFGRSVAGSNNFDHSDALSQGQAGTPQAYRTRRHFDIGNAEVDYRAQRFRRLDQLLLGGYSWSSWALLVIWVSRGT